MSLTPRTLLVAYDIAHRGAARTELAEAIMELGDAWARPLETVWVLRTPLGAEEIEASLAPLVREDDGLMVQELRGEPRFANTGLRWFRPRRAPRDEIGLGAPQSARATPAIRPVLVKAA
jgi:hypothetical protein